MVSPLIVSLERQRNIYGSKILILSPAKLNLYLNVLERYPPTNHNYGYHRIESIMERISIFDRIRMEVLKTPEILFSCSEKSLENKDNLCLKAARLIKEKYTLPYGLRIYLKKVIPVGSGLGGGSSNVASILLGINYLFNLKLPPTDLFSLGSSLGSDVNFFLSQSSLALVKERGEAVYPFFANPLSHLIIWPRISLSTREVYRRLNVKLTRYLSNANIIQYALKRKDIALLQKVIFNVLEKPAFTLCKEIERVKKYFAKKNISLYLSGSGSALYSVGDNVPLSLKAFSQEWLLLRAKTF